MILHDLFSAEDILRCAPQLSLSAPCAMPRRDSRAVCAHDVFFCIRGTRFDGHTAIADAAARGACCAVLDDPAFCTAADAIGIPWILLNDTASAFLPACLAYYGHPERSMTLLAVTGTNGKTSTAYLLEAVFGADVRHAPTACFGTVEYRVAEERYVSSHTTPTPEETALYLSRAHDLGVKTAIFEASSHALSQGRLSGLHFEIGIFTGLGEDHLDYHHSTEPYFEAKRSLFFSCTRGLVNVDDPHGARLYADRAFAGRLTGYSPTDGTAAWRLSALPQALTDTVCPFIAANRLAAAACGAMLGIPIDTACRAMLAMPPIPGRMELLTDTPFAVYLDYAHTPDALRAALTGLRHTYPTARLRVLLGCGGDREREKRPQMGAIAATLADDAVISEDNSRTEDPLAIFADIVSGIARQHRARITLIPDRAAAIAHLLSVSQPGDVILLAGKGHETTQTDARGTRPFSDRDIACSCLKQSSDLRKERTFP
ncbi:MAG: UDP-N-acetylmuramoyl-L-alanyl-D-glutamate--2,6-diaminopimelate ligase [Clostridia bacterium]|nr:UDP-N-acetylmuramoyl-L-alanyl-D-glutamate--2,6-diaminopimelate ligase [Clostridia bacterium]